MTHAAADTGAVPATSKRIPYALDVESLRCYFCRRAHAPETPSTDHELYAELSLAHMTFDDGTFVIAPACGTCLNCSTRPPQVADHVFLDALEAARALDDDLDAELTDADVGSHGATDATVTPASERLLVVDRMLKRLAADEAEATMLRGVQQREIELINRRYAQLAAAVDRRAWWRRQALEALAAECFPNPKSKPKSLNLPYGTIARKDYADAPTVVDPATARASYLEQQAHWHYIQATLKMPLFTLYMYVLGLLQKAGVPEQNGHEGTMPRAALADEWIRLMIEDDAVFEGPPIETDLRWGVLKKAIANAEAPMLDGVALMGARTDFTVAVTSADGAK